jgi:type II secretory pathway pseudopilin PulG
MKLLVMAHPIIAGKVPSKSLGFTYLLVLGFILIVLLSLGATSEHVLLTQQREREAELIFIGKQYQNAITRYYHQSPNGLKQFPMTLENLVNDKRFLTTQHHLRKLYQDPMTQTFEWGLIKNGFGQITGVYSLSNQVPIKKNIDFLKQSGNQIKTYSDWKFEYIAESNATLGLGEPVKTEEAFSTDFTLEPLD